MEALIIEANFFSSSSVYMDERLLDRDQLVFLCEMVNKKEENMPFRIYTINSRIDSHNCPFDINIRDKSP